MAAATAAVHAVAAAIMVAAAKLAVKRVGSRAETAETAAQPAIGRVAGARAVEARVRAVEARVAAAAREVFWVVAGRSETEAAQGGCWVAAPTAAGRKEATDMAPQQCPRCNEIECRHL